VFFEAETSGAAHRATDYEPEQALSVLSRRGGDGTVVVGQLGQSLDGRIATPTGASKYINGREALRHLHRIRAHVDAVLVGVGTAIADDPQLTTRHVPGPNPLRVVVDPRGRLPADRAMLNDGAGPVLAVVLSGTPAPCGVETLELACDGTGRIDPRAIVAGLSRRGIRRILVEGGADTLARFLDAGALDELHLMVAPIVLGSGKTGINLSPIETLDEALRPSVRTMRFRDGDMLCVCELARARVA